MYPLSIDELGQGFVDFLTLGIAGTATIEIEETP
jgi:hypothetical protein